MTAHIVDIWMVWLQYVFSCGEWVHHYEQNANYNQANCIYMASLLYEYADEPSNETILCTLLYTLNIKK